MTGKGLSWCAYFPNDRAQVMMTLEDIRERDAALCAEIERLTRELEIWKRNGGDILLRAEIERLQAENERLKAAIAWTLEVHPGKTKEGCAVVEMTWDQFKAMRVLAALEPKP